MSFIIIIITPSDGDIVTEYDIDPHNESPLEGVHDTIAEFVKHEVSVAVVDVTGEGGPLKNISSKIHVCTC